MGEARQAGTHLQLRRFTQGLSDAGGAETRGFCLMGTEFSKKFWGQTVGMVTQRHGGLTATDVCTKVINLKKCVCYLKY